MREYTGGTTMRDAVEIIGKGTHIQHGKLNDRIYLMKLDEQDIDIVIPELSRIAHENKYSKIFCKVPGNLAPVFFANGFLQEARVPLFYNHKTDAFFVSKYLNSDRFMNLETDKLKQLSTLLTEQITGFGQSRELASEFSIRKLNKSDVEQITEIYREVFESYPFPIHNPGYILKTMEENVQYFGVERAGKLVALSSSEIDFKGANVEMTDFATHPDYTGNGFATFLLNAMEVEMKKQEITTLYTIARLNSIAMNKTFLRNDYRYSGTLIKNTNIAGKIESMNVLYKHL